MNRSHEDLAQHNKALSGPITRLDHSPRLDGLRGLAILMVVLGHLAQYTFGWHSFSFSAINFDISQMGGLGVVVFFCLSGYLITSLMIAEQNRTGSLHLRLFYLRRVLRLYPALLAFLLVLLAIRPFGLQKEIPYLSWFFSLIYLRNIVGHGGITGHLWTLSMEEQFYLVWPLLLVVTPIRRLWPIVITLIVSVSAFRMIEISLHPSLYFRGIFYVHPQYRIDSILAGCLLSLLMYSCPRCDFVERSRAILRWLPIPFLFTLLLLWTTSGSSHHVLYITLQNILAFATLSAIVICPRARSARFLELGWIRWFGRYSYSIYLWQQLFLAAPPRFLGVLAIFPWNVLSCIAVSVASHGLIERPFLQIKDRLRVNSKSSGIGAGPSYRSSASQRWTGQRIAQQDRIEPGNREPYPVPVEAEPDA